METTMTLSTLADLIIVITFVSVAASALSMVILEFACVIIGAIKKKRTKAAENTSKKKIG